MHCHRELTCKRGVTFAWHQRKVRVHVPFMIFVNFSNISLGLIFSIVMQNFAAIRSAVPEIMTFEVTIFGNFPDIPELKLSLAGCDVEKRYVLQSYRSFTFCKRKTRGEKQF